MVERFEGDALQVLCAREFIDLDDALGRFDQRNDEAAGRERRSDALDLYSVLNFGKERRFGKPAYATCCLAVRIKL